MAKKYIDMATTKLVVYRNFFMDGQVKKVHIARFWSDAELKKFLDQYQNNLISEVSIKIITSKEKINTTPADKII